MSNKNLNKYYVTFGMNRGGGHVVVHAESLNVARQIIFASEYGVKWCMMYTEEQWKKMDTNGWIGFNAECKEELFYMDAVSVLEDK